MILDLGYAHGGEFREGFDAGLRHDLSRIEKRLTDAARSRLRRTAEVAVLQTIADIVADQTSGAEAPMFAWRREERDHNTCEVCHQLHGTIIRIGSDEYEEFEPPHHCLGGKRCRGEMVQLGKGLSGWSIDGLITRSDAEAVFGEVSLRHEDPARPTERGGVAFTASRSESLRPTERVDESIVTAADQIAVNDGVRILRSAMDRGKPFLARNMLLALRHLSQSEDPPPFAPRQEGELREVL